LYGSNKELNGYADIILGIGLLVTIEAQDIRGTGQLPDPAGQPLASQHAQVSLMLFFTAAFFLFSHDILPGKDIGREQRVHKNYTTISLQIIKCLSAKERSGRARRLAGMPAGM
jgi:hypothetical protein